MFRNEVAAAGRDGQDLTYIMIDIDHYKKYNDTYGHYEGDRVLQQIGASIKWFAADSGGMVFRLGGEEFGIILSGVDAEEACAYAEHIRSSVEKLGIEHAASPPYGVVTVSVGVAAVKVEGLREEDIYKLADNALYQSKAAGRNRVTLLENRTGVLEQEPGSTES
nr:GGDEF domain-containing protein [Paenibacillus donghaensis]